MKAVIVYYSLTGTTQKLAERMAGMLQCDTLRLPLFSRKVLEGQYDLVIVGTPIWLYGPAFPTGGFLSRNKGKLPEVAFFCTYQTTIGASFSKMEHKCGKKPLGSLKLKAGEIGSEAGDQQLKECLDKIRK